VTPSAYIPPSTGRQLKAVLFDTFGTVVDWRSGVAAEAGRFAERHGLALDSSGFADKWRAEYQPAMELVRSGQRGYVPLDQRHLENLKRVLMAGGVSPDEFSPDELEELNRAWERLPAWPDSREGLQQLKSRYVVGPLSNGNTALLVNMAKNAGLPWDVVVGSDLLQAYKPDAAEGIKAFRWAKSVDDVHSVLANPRADELGAVPLLNSWGPGYPHRTYLPDAVLAKLIDEEGEIAVPTDR
jgi:2-haloalkanoic acid dehalogenase type II